jgi:subtilisin family serine protease
VPGPVAAEPAPDISDVVYDGDRHRCAQFGGAVIVAAAGNGGSSSVREYPAAEHAYGLMAIAASTSAARLAPFSNSGSWIAVAAPGDGITSSVPGGGFAVWSGTSMAAPLAAGTVALVRSSNRAMTADDAARRVAQASGNLCGTQLRVIDALAALTGVVPTDRPCR